MQVPMVLNCPGSHGRHWVCDSSGCVPGRHASHEMPSSPYSFSPQSSQKVEESLNVQRLPGSHGLSAHVATDDAMIHSGVIDSSAGSSIVVFVMRRLVAAVTDSDAPFGAALTRKMLSRITTVTGPIVEAAPPFPEVARKSKLVHEVTPFGQQSAATSPGMQPTVHPSCSARLEQTSR